MYPPVEQRARAGQAATAHRRPSHPGLVILLLAVLVAAGATGVLAARTDVDPPPDLSGFLRSASGLGSGLTWPVLACLLGVSAVHYTAATVAARAAAGVEVPFGELFTAQFAAATANRLTPAGLGGAAVLGRYLCRRGPLNVAESTAAVAALAVLGSLADAMAFAGLLSIGMLTRVPGASAELPLLASRFIGIVPMPRGVLLWIVLGAVALVATACLVPRVRASAPAGRAARAASAYRHTLADLFHHPVRVIKVMAGSSLTTLSLSTGFAATAILGPTHLPAVGFGALMIGYMVASAAANALPTPGGIGTADAALTGVLVTAGSAASPALATVLAFRVVSFWLPALIGIPIAHHLHRRGAL